MLQQLQISQLLPQNFKNNSNINFLPFDIIPKNAVVDNTSTNNNFNYFSIFFLFILIKMNDDFQGICYLRFQMLEV